MRDRPEDEWEALEKHLSQVASCAKTLASAFGCGSVAEAAGLMHDVGKVSPAFQAYLRGTAPRGPDHSTAGAKVAVQELGAKIGLLLAYGIAGHHSGLPDWEALDGRLTKKLEPYAGWEEHAGPLPSLTGTPPGWSKAGPGGFGHAFLIRMLFSCLVDADTIETRRFYAEQDPEPPFRTVPVLLDLLRGYQDSRAAPAKPIDVLRAEVLAYAIQQAALQPGLFTLTVPTGGGKTLTSLRFALEHAARHGLRRVIYVIPYTSIIEQTAKVFRDILGDDVLEHHANFDAEAVSPPDEDGQSPAEQWRRAAENWDAPIIVTTAVQFFESLFAARRRSCRKLHNIAQSVIVLDEAQTLPLGLLRPCLAALDELQRNYGASVVLCTATQPAVRKQDEFKGGGLDIPAERELAPDPPKLYARLKRVRAEYLAGPVEDDVVAARFAEAPQMLCIVNTRRHAAELFQRIREQDGAVHLSTLMVPPHRRAVLERVRQRLKDGKAVRLVATSLIEAGVDVDFPEVWRAEAGLDSVAQAAGRCNREGKPELGRVVVFKPALHPAPRDVAQAAESAALARHGSDDALALATVQNYFRLHYWQKGAEAFDTAKIDGRPGILPAIAEGKSRLRFPFEKIAAAFRMIDDAMDPVIVPYDAEAIALLKRIASMDRPLSADLRALQQYTVTIPPKQRSAWLAQGVLRPVHPRLGEAMLRLDSDTLYDPAIGLRLDEVITQTQF